MIKVIFRTAKNKKIIYEGNEGNYALILDAMIKHARRYVAGRPYITKLIYKIEGHAKYLHEFYNFLKNKKKMHGFKLEVRSMRHRYGGTRVYFLRG